MSSIFLSNAMLVQVAEKTSYLVDEHNRFKPLLHTEKWIVVLKDPRGERRKQRAGGVGYRLPHNYDKSLFLQRLASQVSHDHGLNLIEQWPIKSLNVHCLVIEVVGDEKLILARLQEDKRVKWIQPYQIFEGLESRDSSSHNKPPPQKNSPWNTQIQNNKLEHAEDPYRQLQTIFENIGISRLKPSLDGSGISIAMIDSGVEIAHSDLFQADILYKNFVSQDVLQNKTSKLAMQPAEHHGTGIASVMIAQVNNGKGIAGISPAAMLYAYRGCWELENGFTRCSTLSLSRALDSIVDVSPNILNLSLTGPQDRLLESLLTKVIANGTTVVSAFDENRSSGKRFPSRRNGVIFAGDVSSEVLSSNKFVSIPGSEILAAQPVNTYAFLSGNSLSSAHLTAVLALLKQAVPELSWSKLNQLLTMPIKSDPSDHQIDVCDLLRRLQVKNYCF